MPVNSSITLPDPSDFFELPSFRNHLRFLGNPLIDDIVEPLTRKHIIFTKKKIKTVINTFFKKN